jgi:hypothetical protein
MPKKSTAKPALQASDPWRDGIVKKYVKEFVKQGNTNICVVLTGSDLPEPRKIGEHVPDITCTDFTGRTLVVAINREPDLSPDGTEKSCAWRTFGKYAFFNADSAFMFIVPKGLKEKADTALRGFCLRGSVIGEAEPEA